MLFSQIKLGYPSLWVKSVDTFKTIESIVNFDSRAYFMINSSGFSQYVDGVWKPVLVPMPNPNNPEEQIFTSTYDFTVANEFLKSYETNLPKTFIFNIFAQHNEFVSTFAGIFNNATMQYRDAFWSNDVTQMPTQYIVISNADCPQDFNHIFKAVETSYPTREEIITVLSHLDKASEGLLVRQPVKSIVDAALGLSESEFINLSLQSVLEVGEVSADYIYAQKMKDIKKNGILEIIKPKVHFNNIGGLDTIKDLIIRNANLWHNPDQAAKFGISPIRRMLMVGIPGTGKSAICEATANALGLDLARTGVSQVMNSYIGQSEQNMRLVFQQIHAMSPLCVWIDEFGRDLSGGSSSSHVDGGTTDRVHGEFLTGLQELPEDTFLLCAANSLDSLRPEMLRADRFDKIMFVGLPSFEERKHIFQIHLSKIDTDHSYDYDSLAQATQYMTGAEIVSLIRETKFYVVSESLRPIETNDILTYAPKMKNIIWMKHNETVVSMYKYALEQWDWASTEQMNDAIIMLSKTSPQKQPASVTWK